MIEMDIKLPVVKNGVSVSVCGWKRFVGPSETEDWFIIDGNVDIPSNAFLLMHTDSSYFITDGEFCTPVHINFKTKDGFFFCMMPQFTTPSHASRPRHEFTICKRDDLNIACRIPTVGVVKDAVADYIRKYLDD